MLHGYRFFSEEIFIQYHAVQTIMNVFSRQAKLFRMKKRPEKARFCQAFFDFQKKPKVSKKGRIS